MSSYINFYLKSNNNDFVPVGTYSRSSEVYQVANNDVPYDKVAPVSKADIIGWVSEVEDRINRYKDMISRDRDMIAEIKQFNNSLEEKEEAIYEYLSSIKDTEDCIEECRWALGYFRTLANIYNEGEDTKYYKEERRINPETYIWAGVEGGYPIGVDANGDATYSTWED